MKALEFIIGANITYSGITETKKLKVEYKHTGGYYFTKGRKGTHILSGEESAKEKREKGIEVLFSSGHYFINRLAIQTITAHGEMDWWYINNDGDACSVNKTSKYAKKLHAELSKETVIEY